jgi:hypothetical protein
MSNILDSSRDIHKVMKEAQPRVLAETGYLESHPGMLMIHQTSLFNMD